MSPLVRNSASVQLEPVVTPSEFRPVAEPDALLTRGEASAFQGLTWLTVGLGVLVTGLAVALTVLAIFQ